MKNYKDYKEGKVKQCSRKCSKKGSVTTYVIMSKSNN